MKMKCVTFISLFFILVTSSQAAIIELEFSGTTRGVKSWSDTGSGWDRTANAFSGVLSFDNSTLMGNGDGVWTSRFYDAITGFSIAVNQGNTNFDYSITAPYDNVISSEIYQSFNGFNYVNFQSSLNNQFWNLYMELDDSVTGFANTTLDLDQRDLVGGGYFVLTYQDRDLNEGFTFNGRLSSVIPLAAETLNSAEKVSAPSAVALLLLGVSFMCFQALKRSGRCLTDKSVVIV